MKNFTNNFKQFTSRLSARWLIMALMMLVGTSSAWAANITGGEVFYLTPHTAWNSDNARYAIYFFNNSTGKNTWTSMTKVEGESNLWTATAPSGTWANLIFCRMNPGTTANNWNSGVYWGGQTQDLTFDGTKNWFTVNSSKDAWNKPAGTWSTIYNITYNANGGSGAPSAQIKKNDTNLTLSSTVPTRSGYEFTGWNTKSDGTGTSYASGASYTANAAATLYAQWKKSCEAPAVPTLSADKTSLVAPDNATLTVGNTTSGLTYKLYNSTNEVASKTSTGSDLTFEIDEAGNYTVSVTNDCGSTSTSTPAVVITVCTPQTNEFRHANSSYTQLANQPTYYPGDKVYFVSTIDCCLTGTWSNNLQKGEEGWWTGLTGKTPKFSMTLTRAGNFTITNMANNGCTQDKNVLVNLNFTVTALSQVTNANGTASGANIALTWKHSANHSNVMVVRYPINETETIPAGGQAYTAGNTLGGGTVVYVGTAESCTDKNLPAGASYKYYFYTVNNNYYSEGVVLNMSSCPTPAKPQLTSSAVTTCNGNVTTSGSITITNMEDYDNTYTFTLGDEMVEPDANGIIVISSAANREYTVTVTNSCGNQNSADVDIAINDNKPTITGETFTQPGRQNKIELTVPDGITAKWSVSPAADLSVTEGKSTMFSAETNGTYTITATNGTCSDTHVVTVADAFYIWVRNAKESDAAYGQFYYPNENSEAVRGGEMFYAECDALPTKDNYTTYNKGGRKADLVKDDCDGYTWYGFKASADVIARTKYFYVHATNDLSDGGYYTHSKPLKSALSGDVYYTLGTTGDTFRGWNLSTADAPYAGPKVHASGDAKFNANNFADFVSLYVTDCSGNEVTGYQWSYTAPTCTYIGKKTVTMSASTSNNIRVREAGSYTCTVTYKDGNTATSPALTVSTGATNTPALAEFTSNLPIIMVNTNGVGFPDCTGLSGQTASKNASTLKEKRSVDVIIKDGNKIIYDRKARMNYRGSSSLNFVKKSYAFCPGEADCVEDKGRQDYVKTAKLNMLGLGEAYDKDWVLYAAAADPSLMRNRLVFDSYAAMTGEWGVQSSYVELIVDGVYKGVYVFMDKITMNEKRVKVDKKTGFIVKFDKTDKEDRIGGYEGKIGDEKTFATDLTGRKDISTYDTSVDQLFEIEYPEKDDYPTGWGNRTTAIKNMFNNFENALKDGDFTTVQQYIDYTSWADWFIINEYTKNVDAYRASCIFVYTGEAGAKIEARPLWDQELSFNNTATTVGNGKGCNSTSGLLVEHDAVYKDGFPAPFWFTGNYSTSNGQFTKDKYKGLLDDPCFVQVVKERWETHKADALSEASLQKLITEYYNDLADYDESTKTYAQTSAKTREVAFWTNKSRGACDCSYDTSNATATGYSNVTMDDSKGTMDTWVLDAQRRAGLSTALSGLTGTTMNIQIIPSSQETTPWEAATITINKSEGYDYTLENDLEAVSGVVVQKNGQSITYRIPRPSDWGTGDGNDSRDDITYTITATLNVADGTMVCGTTTAPSSTATIILQDEKDENCPQ